MLAMMKLDAGCTDCGYNAAPEALDFDHVRGDKKRNVSSCKTIQSALDEAEKCEVVCANCHRIRTLDRMRDKAAGLSDEGTHLVTH